LLKWDAVEFPSAIRNNIPQITTLLMDGNPNVRKTALTAVAKLSEQREQRQLFETAGITDMGSR
jgi:vesicle coat complex subunit